MARSGKGSINRRGFLKGAAAGAAASAATIVSGVPAAAQQQAAAGTPAQPTQAQLAREAGPGPGPAAANARIIENPGSDYMVDVFRALGIEFVAANPGSSFEGLQESFVNYGDNKPEF